MRDWPLYLVSFGLGLMASLGVTVWAIPPQTGMRYGSMAVFFAAVGLGSVAIAWAFRNWQAHRFAASGVCGAGASCVAGYGFVLWQIATTL